MMPGERHTLTKEERLHGKKDISALLSLGKFGETAGMRHCIRRGTGCRVNRMMVSVPKKNFKRAVVRNLLKRRIRESYRLQKGLLPAEGGIDILFMYSSREILPFSEIRSTVGRILEKAAKNG